jgi:hypothetical protein
VEEILTSNFGVRSGRKDGEEDLGRPGRMFRWRILIFGTAGALRIFLNSSSGERLAGLRLVVAERGDFVGVLAGRAVGRRRSAGRMSSIR